MFDNKWKRENCKVLYYGGIERRQARAGETGNYLEYCLRLRKLIT